MLIYALRAAILIGVLGWYSTGVWKMIDGYFKDRFEKYLREEYIKNPRIKTDLDAYRAKNNKMDRTIKTPNLMENSINKNTIVHNNENNGQFPDNLDVIDTTKVNFEKERDTKNGTKATSFSSIGCNDVHRSEYHENIKTFANVPSSKQLQLPPATNNKAIGQSSTIDLMNKKKQRIKMTIFTDIDSEITELDASADYDFSEFEYNENNGDSAKKVHGGIKVVDLPFKPRADLGHLDTVTEDEYCPFNLDNHEENCKDTRKWP